MKHGTIKLTPADLDRLHGVLSRAGVWRADFILESATQVLAAIDDLAAKARATTQADTLQLVDLTLEEVSRG